MLSCFVSFHMFGTSNAINYVKPNHTEVKKYEKIIYHFGYIDLYGFSIIHLCGSLGAKHRTGLQWDCTIVIKTQPDGRTIVKAEDDPRGLPEGY